MIKKQTGKKNVRVGLSDDGFDAGVWFFCENGWQSTGVAISVELFDIMRDMVTNPDVVEYYESIRGAEPTILDK